MTTITSNTSTGLTIESDTSGSLTFISGNSNISMQIDSTGTVDLSASRLILPVGNTAARANVTGAVRFNNESNVFEAYNGSAWTTAFSSEPTSTYSLDNPYGLHMKDPQKNIWRLLRYNNLQRGAQLTATDLGSVGGVDFNEDGTRMFLLNNPNDKIHEFYIAEGWDVANAAYTGNSTTLSGAGDPHDLIFKPDGTKLYVASRASPAGIVEYSLSTAWDLSTVSISNTFISTAQETAPYALHIGDDGYALYLYGQTSDTVYEYRMATAWDLSTISYSGNSYPVAEATPYNIFLSDDGVHMYTYGQAQKLLKLHTLSTPWNLSTATFTKNLLRFLDQSLTQVFTIKPANQGQRLNFVDILQDIMLSYTVNNPWGDMGLGFLSVAAQDATPFGFYIKPDGTKLYVAGTTTDRIYEYDMSIPYDTATAIYTANVSFAANSAIDTGFTMSTDGNHFFLSSIYEVAKWTMAVPWDITTANFTAHRNLQGVNGRYSRIEFNSDGTKSYGVIKSTTYQSDILNQLQHPPYDVANTTFDRVYMLNDLFGNGAVFDRMRFNEDGTKVYLLASAGNQGYIVEYAVSIPYDLHTAIWKNPKQLNIAVFGDRTGDTRDFAMLNGSLYLLSNQLDGIQQIRITE